MNEPGTRINWRRGSYRLWLVGCGFWIVSHGVTLIQRGGFDLSARLLRFEVVGESFVFPAEFDNAKIVTTVVARGAAKAKKDNEGIAERCAAAKISRATAQQQTRQPDVSPTGGVFDPWAALGIDPLECVPEVGLVESMIVGPVYEARGRVLPPLGATWRDFLLSGFLPPFGVMVLGWLSAWIVRGFHA